MRRVVGKQVGIFVILMVFLFSVFFLLRERIKYNLDLNKLTQDDFSFVFQIDELIEEEKYVTLKGWAFVLGKDSSENDMEIMLFNLDKEKFIYGDAEEYIREDVNEHFSCEYDYSQSGFVVNFKKKDVGDDLYQVLVHDKLNQTIFQTSVYLSNDGLSYVNPLIDTELKTKETQLRKIEEEGILKYKSEIGLFVYQFEEYLYWIFDNTKISLDLYCPFHLHSYQISNGFENSDFVLLLETAEVIGDYYVVKQNIDKTYAITKVSIGGFPIHESENWLWSASFRPFYNFECE